jgi:hypothetical protein
MKPRKNDQERGDAIQNTNIENIQMFGRRKIKIIQNMVNIYRDHDSPPNPLKDIETIL